MKKFWLPLVGLVLAIGLTNCSTESSEPQITELNTFSEEISYAFGMNIGQSIQNMPYDSLDLDILITALKDVVDSNEVLLDDKEMMDVFQEFQTRQQKIQEEENKAKFGNIQAEGQAFLAMNAQREEVISLPSGLQYEVIKKGNGPMPTAESKVTVHYHGTLTDGTVFDSSIDRGEPAKFPVGGVIAGWTEALQLMPVGSKWKLYIPQNLAYGERGAGQMIPPYASLIFDVELISIDS